ncbi:hypothetical protein ACWCQ0_40105 [Streptomyces massasporeus]|uniref:ABM domain-containing protein n=1 Tax=Streptomyces massasporeus TaxID=67324 RepID=A0ABW6LFZ9_9ACTN
MAVVLTLRWAGVAPEQYDAMLDTVGWEKQVPDGLVLHVAWFEQEVMHVTDVWDAEDDFRRFYAERLAPAVQVVGLAGQPDVRFTPVHRRFVAPGAGGGA